MDGIGPRVWGVETALAKAEVIAIGVPLSFCIGYVSARIVNWTIEKAFGKHSKNRITCLIKSAIFACVMTGVAGLSALLTPSFLGGASIHENAVRANQLGMHILWKDWGKSLVGCASLIGCCFVLSSLSRHDGEW